LLESSSFSAWGPQIRFDQSGNGFAVWGQGSALFVSRYDKASNSWQSPFIANSKAVAEYNLYVDSSGNAIVSWTENDFNAFSENVCVASAKRFDVASGTWFAREQLEGENGCISAPLGAINAAGQAITIRTQQLPIGYFGLVANRYTGGGWSAATSFDSND